MTLLSDEEEAAMREALRTGQTRMFTGIEIETEKVWCQEHREEFSLTEMHRRAWVRERGK